MDPDTAFFCYGRATKKCVHFHEAGPEPLEALDNRPPDPFESDPEIENSDEKRGDEDDGLAGINNEIEELEPCEIPFFLA